MMDKTKTILSALLIAVILLGIFLYMNYFRTFTVTFEAKIGPGIEVQEVKKGGVVTEPKMYNVDGYIFAGWYKDDELYDFSTPVSENITLTARWNGIDNAE